MRIWKKLFGDGNSDDQRDGPVRPDLDQLLNSDDTNGSIIELDNYISALCEYGEALERLSAEQKNFYFNQSLEREVNNGGFDQFFFNSTGDFAHETLESLGSIGALKTAEILQEAINEFPNGIVPKDRAQRGSILEMIAAPENEVWEELDQRFFAYEDDLNTLNMKYVKRNKERFRT